MHIIDREGTKIIITDLAASLQMVRLFLEDYRPANEPSIYRMEQNRFAYWQDFLEKLLILQKTLNKKKS